MKLNTSFYSLFNANIVYGPQSNQLPRKPMNELYSKSDVDSLSLGAGKQFSANQKQLLSLTEIKGQQVKQLTAVNNSIDFNADSFYKLQTRSGRTVILTSDNEGTVYMPYSELNLIPDSFTPSDYKEIDKVEKLFTFLSSDMTAYSVRTNYTKDETKGMLDSVGIKPGWFEIKNGSKSNKFYMLNDGTIYPKYQVDAQRDYLNMKNFFKDGYTKDSVFEVDGKDYKLDDNGHLHIPEGTACLQETIKMIKKVA